MTHKLQHLTAIFLCISLFACKGKNKEPAINLDELKTLPYLAVVDTSTEEEGVVLYDRERAYPGLNTFCSQAQIKGFLMDMDGSMMKTWRFKGHVGHVEVNDAGELFVLKKDEGFLKVDWNGNRLWLHSTRGHHDFDFWDDGGDIYLIINKAINVRHKGATYPILDDHIQVLSANGDPRESYSLYDLLGQHIREDQWRAIAAYVKLSAGKSTKEPLENQRNGGKKGVKMIRNRGTPYDVFHTNAVEILKRDVPGIAQKGDLLLSVRELDMILITDPKLSQVRWSFGPGEISRQHHPSLLRNNNILLFDNGTSKEASRVIEIDPKTNQIVWSYPGPGSTAESFYSSFRGAAQRLPNGNTLITDSTNGRSFEVTPDGRTVWMYYAAINNRGKREVIYQMLRVWGTTEERLRKRAQRDHSSSSH